ncbi:MAG TPA: DUF1036 domain-containing protein [Actinoallomurus sp.]
MITIYNNFRTTISAMVEWFHPNCPDGGDWEKKGWWVIQPQQTAIVWGGDHNAVNRFWYGYVHSIDGAQWTGDFPETVPTRAFQWCEHVADTTSRTVRMVEHDALDSGPNWVWMFGNVVH